MKNKMVEFIKKKYPIGTKILLKSMNDEKYPVPSGTKGVVIKVDDIGTIHCSWENGSSLGLIEGLDEFEIIK